jgi:hypothetical protein
MSGAILSGICIGEAKVASTPSQVNTGFGTGLFRAIYHILIQLVTEIGSSSYNFRYKRENLNQIVR